MTLGASSALQVAAGLCVLALAAAALVRERRDWRRRALPRAPRPVPPRAWQALQRTTLPAAGAAAAAGLLLVIDAALAEGAARPVRVLLGALFVTGLALAVSTALAARPVRLVPPALRRRRRDRAGGASRGDSGPAT